MKDCLLVGMALGFIAGAVLVQGNREAQELVKQGKKAVKDKIEEIKDNISESKETA